MDSDASSVSTFSSLDNVSRSNMLRRQREAALRRRQFQVPSRGENNFGGADGGGGRPASSSSSSSHRMGSMTTSAMADVMAWEEAKTKERIEARIKEEEIQRVKEARKAEMARALERRAELARAAEAEADAARRAEMERFEREKRASQEASRRLKEEARRLAEAKAEAERLEKERLAEGAEKRAELERLEKELIRERLEKERLAEEAAKRAELEKLANELMRERLEKERLVAAARANAETDRLAEQQSLERRFCAPNQGGGMNGVDSNGTRMTQRREPVPEHESQPILLSNEEACGHVPPEMIGSNIGYQHYLSTYHQPAPVAEGNVRGESRGDATVISELTDGNISPEPASVRQAGRNGTLHTSKTTESKGSRLKRTISTRSMSFTDVGEADRSTSDQDSAEGTEQVSNSRPESSKASEGKTTPKQEVSKSASSKPSSFQQMKITSAENVNLDDPVAMRSFLMDPCPKGEGMIQCCVKRSKGIKKALFPEYRMYLKTNNSKTETFLMTSKKRAGNKSSNYLISMNRNDHDKKSDSILGKLRSNFLGTEYMIYDHGKNPDYDESYNDDKSDEAVRCELGAILYAASTSLGAKGPRKMRVCIGKMDEGGNPLKVWQPSKDDERMLTCFKKETFYFDKLACLENKPPSWNDEVGAYVLNFNGRVTQASVKNFQLCALDDEKEQIMQFGRTGKDEFSLDVRWPMSLFQAFSVALSSFDSKLGCD